jgi:pimeloyl-ACP methyl ester carboxylesterase
VKTLSKTTDRVMSVEIVTRWSPDGSRGPQLNPRAYAADARHTWVIPKLEAMEQVYAGDDRGNPFAWLSAIDCPVCVATAENSWVIYKEMAARAVALIPGASRWTFDGVGHCVAQGAPDLLLQALEAFETQTA